jgi:hypothetical protein
MVDSLQTAAELTDEDILALYRGGKCSSCGRVKPGAQAFCAICTGGLTLWARNYLSRGPDNAQFLASFRSAARHLALTAEMRREQYLRRRGWPYKVHAELDAAGYRFSSHAQCASPRCLAPITWYITPGGRYLAVNQLPDCQPHSETCRDPEFWCRRQERRAVKTSAKRRKRA